VCRVELTEFSLSFASATPSKRTIKPSLKSLLAGGNPNSRRTPFQADPQGSSDATDPVGSPGRRRPSKVVPVGLTDPSTEDSFHSASDSERDRPDGFPASSQLPRRGRSTAMNATSEQKSPQGKSKNQNLSPPVTPPNSKKARGGR
jgi:hypothetical protein